MTTTNSNEADHIDVVVAHEHEHEETKNSPIHKKSADLDRLAKLEQEYQDCKTKANEKLASIEKEEQEEQMQLTKKERSNLLDINIGFLSINERGIKMKPKFDFGASVAGTGALIGLGDVRDGINFGVDIDVVSQTVHGCGKDMNEFLSSLEFQGRIAEILDETIHLNKIIQFFTKILGEISSLCKIGTIHVAHVEGTCNGKIGSSMGGGISLGWKDEEKYRMIGAAGKAIYGGEFRAGLHESKKKIKVISAMVLGGGVFRFVVYIRRKESDDIPPVSIKELVDDNILLHRESSLQDNQEKEVIQENSNSTKQKSIIQKVGDRLGISHHSNSSEPVVDESVSKQEAKKQPAKKSGKMLLPSSMNSIPASQITKESNSEEKQAGKGMLSKVGTYLHIS